MTRAAHWLEYRYPVSDPRARVFCFPHAGGTASSYYDWAPRLAPTVEVVPVQLPGRGRLLGEAPCTDVAEVAEAVAPLIAAADDVPVVLFGHSMGAILAHEVTARLEGRDAAPLRLVASGRPAPSRRPPGRDVHSRSRAELVQVLRDYDATPAEVLDDEELLDVVLPMIRADFRMIESYRWDPAVRLRTPVTALGGDADPGVTRDDVLAWREHTRGSFEARILPGGHFFLRDRRDEVLQVVRRAALAA